MSKLGISASELKAQHSEEVKDLKKKLKRYEKLLEDYKKSHGSIANFFDSIKDYIPTYAPTPINYKPQKPKTRTNCGMAMLICDTHYGAIQPASEVEGFGEYSPELCEHRCEKFTQNVIEWANLQRSAYPIENLHILVAGDLISGDIHDELRVTNAFPVTKQVVGASHILARQILMAAQHFKIVNIHFIVEDNHARLTKKPQAKEAGINSLNYIVGNMTNILVSKQKNVEFHIYPQYEAVVNVEGRRYLLLHGHNIMGWGGIPYYGIDRKTAKEAIKRMNASHGLRFDKVIMGHLHHPVSHPIYWIGGSVSGTDAYDHKNGRHSAPSQASWLVHPKHGEFARIDWKL